MSSKVTDLAQVRADRGDAARTLLCQVSNVRAEAEVHRQIGFSDALTLEELHRILEVCFGLPEESSPWHFFEHHDARGQRIDPSHTVREFLRREGEQIDYAWGLWDFEIVVVETYPRDGGTPEALCVGGSGSFQTPFDLTAVNAELTGQETIDEVLDLVAAPIRALIERSRLYDFVPLLQALDLHRGINVDGATLNQLRTLPREVTNEGKDAFWSMALALSCMGGRALTDSVVETSMAALGWVDDDGEELHGSDIRELCTASLDVLASLGAYGVDAAAPVDRLDIYRALVRG
ncbi:MULTISPECIES: hypothetical protein [Corynebacterium]|uniref:Plasmid pRiA4b ORF-3 family protein n=1 Tax=Corynebacterium singulare TaxID=161899 RepID=A0ABS9PWW4_9CORY|nr:MULTISPECIES: hypothetical protein [Corynebacterium]MCG7277183.1 plasmid pRiA4b ORF-3 family protein [Corynebacterium singulare]MCQ9677652.1 plasmid pRiA4b ORF-3 family protein [Corynebacterium sp. BF-R-2]OFT62298.1 hypothetical protein HMPREF3149_04280 [Corynebacterium sp. HMSC05E07]